MTNSKNLLLCAILAAGTVPKRKPTRDELAEFEYRCLSVSLAELGHLLFTAETEEHLRVAERATTMRLGTR